MVIAPYVKPKRAALLPVSNASPRWLPNPLAPHLCFRSCHRAQGFCSLLLGLSDLGATNFRVVVTFCVSHQLWPEHLCSRVKELNIILIAGGTLLAMARGVKHLNCDLTQAHPTVRPVEAGLSAGRPSKGAGRKGWALPAPEATALCKRHAPYSAVWACPLWL